MENTEKASGDHAVLRKRLEAAIKAREDAEKSIEALTASLHGVSLNPDTHATEWLTQVTGMRFFVSI